MSPKFIPDNPSHLLKLYRDGRSVKAISQEVGVCRQAIKKFLQSRGVKTRNRSESMFNRMKYSTKEQRLAWSKAAHDSTKGVPRSIESGEKLAMTRFRSPWAHLIGAAEKTVLKGLVDLKHDVSYQHPLGVYNLDFLIGGSIAVELRSETSFPHNRPSQKKKIEEIRKRGFGVIYVGAINARTLEGCADQVITLLDGLCRNPATKSQYWMIRCHSERFARFRDNRGQFSCVPTPEKFFCTSHKINL